MGQVGAQKLRFRKSFQKIPEVMDIPNLIDIQKTAYDNFLQKDVAPEQRQVCGLQWVFNSVFPIRNYNETSELEFVSYSLGSPKYDIDECRLKELTLASPLKVLIRLVNYDPETKNIRDIKEQEVYFGEIPLMTENGTFVINGTERVVVSQLHRSPGVFFDHDRGKTLSSGKFLYSARIIPSRGSWIDLEYDPKDIIYVRIDRRRKFPVTVLLKALGYSDQELLAYFYTVEDLLFDEAGVRMSIRSPFFGDGTACQDIVDKRHEVIVKKGRKFNKVLVSKLRKAGIEYIPVADQDVVDRVVAEDVTDPATGEVVFKCNDRLTADGVLQIKQRGIKRIKILYIDLNNVDSSPA